MKRCRYCNSKLYSYERITGTCNQCEFNHREAEHYEDIVRNLESFLNSRGERTRFNRLPNELTKKDRVA